MVVPLFRSSKGLQKHRKVVHLRRALVTGFQTSWSLAGFQILFGAPYTKSQDASIIGLLANPFLLVLNNKHPTYKRAYILGLHLLWGCLVLAPELPNPEGPGSSSLIQASTTAKISGKLQGHLD